jgi:type II secretory pathway pseudopilin PulG
MFVVASGRAKINAGYTLYEMMAALVLVSLFMIVIARVFYVYQQAWQRQLTLHRHQEAARKVYAVVRDSIHMAGHVGCRRVSADFAVRPYERFKLNQQNQLHVEQDRLGVIYQYFPVAAVIKSMRNGLAVYADTGVWFRARQYLIISDCQHAEIFQAVSVSPEHGYQIIYPLKPLKYRYRSAAEIGRLISRELYSNGDFMVKKRIFERSYHYARNVSGLSFAADDKGVAFEFDTHFGGLYKHWYGYASR